MGQLDELEKGKLFYQNYINGLDKAHFIVFALSAPSVIRRLLAIEGSLQNFTVTYVPSGDEIAHPLDKKIESGSKEAYSTFAKKIESRFEFGD